MEKQPKDAQPTERNFDAKGAQIPGGINHEGPDIHPLGHEMPPRMPTEHRENSPHHAGPGGKKREGKK